MRKLLSLFITFLFFSIGHAQVNFRSVAIESQIWMQVNLDVTTYSNGDLIPHITDASKWAETTTGAWCYYENDPANGKNYGKLYNLYAVLDPRGLAPKGWRIPKKDDWEELMLQTRSDGMLINNIGFNMNLGGLRGGLRGGGGWFGNLNATGYYWASTTSFEENVYTVELSAGSEQAGFTTGGGQGGKSIRCIKNK